MQICFFRVLFQHHLPAMTAHVGAGEAGGDGEAHCPVPRLQTPGQRRRERGQAEEAALFFRRHGVQQVRHHQSVIVQKFPAAHLNPQRDDLKVDGGGCPSRPSAGHSCCHLQYSTSYETSYNLVLKIISMSMIVCPSRFVNEKMTGAVEILTSSAQYAILLNSLKKELFKYEQRRGG